MFVFLGVIVGFLEDAAIAALEATLAVLQWAVAALWAFATSVYNGMIALGSHVLEGFQKAWDFLKSTYEDVLKPAWDKLSQLFNRVRDWLNETFGPVIRALQSIRKYILDFYAQWIRPVLDAIQATQAILKILEALHIAWAQELDNVLQEISDGINSALREVLGPLNRVIGIVNGVITGDLLFARFPFLMSLKRDVAPVARMLTQARTRALTSDEGYKIFRATETDTQTAVVDDIVAMFEGGDSEIVAPFVADASDEWVKLLGLDETTAAAT